MLTVTLTRWEGAGKLLLSLQQPPRLAPTPLVIGLYSSVALSPFQPKVFPDPFLAQ